MGLQAAIIRHLRTLAETADDAKTTITVPGQVYTYITPLLKYSGTSELHVTVTLGWIILSTIEVVLFQRQKYIAKLVHWKVSFYAEESCIQRVIN